MGFFDPSGVFLLLKQLEYFSNIGVKGYRIDRGEGGEMLSTHDKDRPSTDTTIVLKKLSSGGAEHYR